VRFAQARNCRAYNAAAIQLQRFAGFVVDTVHQTKCPHLITGKELAEKTKLKLIIRETRPRLAEVTAASIEDGGL